MLFFTICLRDSPYAILRHALQQNSRIRRTFRLKAHHSFCRYQAAANILRCRTFYPRECVRYNRLPFPNRIFHRIRKADIFCRTASSENYRNNGAFRQNEFYSVRCKLCGICFGLYCLGSVKIIVCVNISREKLCFG